MDSESLQGNRDPLMEQLSINRRIRSYKECVFRSYAFGLAALSIVSSMSYFTLKRYLLIHSNKIVMLSGCFGSVAGYLATKEASKDCNAILQAHRESMRRPVSANDTDQKV